MIIFSKINKKIVGYTPKEDEIGGEYYLSKTTFEEFILPYTLNNNKTKEVYRELIKSLDEIIDLDGKINQSRMVELETLVITLLKKERIENAIKLIKKNYPFRLILL